MRKESKLETRNDQSPKHSFHLNCRSIIIIIISGSDSGINQSMALFNRSQMMPPLRLALGVVLLCCVGGLPIAQGWTSISTGRTSTRTMRPGRPFSPVSVSVPFLRATPSDGIGTELFSAHATTQNKDNDDESATTTTTTTGKHVRALMATVALASTCLLFSVPESFAATPTTTTTTTTPPTPSAGVVSSNNYRCPKLVASQTLGIQNVVRQSTKISRPSALGSSEAAALYCPMKASDSYDASEDAYRYSVRGLIYLPSGNNREDREDSNRSDGTQQQKQKQKQLSSALSTSSESSLVVTVRSSRDPSSSILLMGARIPMAQIESFPVSFVLSSGNFLMADTAWERSILDASDALSVTARVVCDKTSSNGNGNGSGSGNDSGSGCPSQELEGIGIARTLLVPNIGDDNDSDNDNDNDFRKVRGAASIRLGRATAPDPLYTW